MIVLAYLSFFMAVFLPGMIALGLLRFGGIFHSSNGGKGGKSQPLPLSATILFSFLLSVAFNYLFVSLTGFFHLYTRGLMLYLLAIEVALFIALYLKDAIFGLRVPSLGRSIREHPLLFALLLVCALALLVQVYPHKRVFMTWDAIVSWNRWGIEWASDMPVVLKESYSQGYPILLSLGYILSGMAGSYEGVGIGIYYYFGFCLMVAYIFLFIGPSLGRSAPMARLGRALYPLIASIISLVLIFNKGFTQFYVGYVDMLVMALSAIGSVLLVCALWGREGGKSLLAKVDSTSTQEVESNLSKTVPGGPSTTAIILFGALAVGTSIGLKQAGLFSAPIYLLGLALFWRELGLRRCVFIYAVLIILLAGSPYLLEFGYKKLVLHTAATNSAYTMGGIFHGVGYLGRLVAAFAHFKALSVLALLSALALFVPSLLKRAGAEVSPLDIKLARYLGASALVYYLAWGCLLSYDARNASLLSAYAPLAIASFIAPLFAFLKERYALSLGGGLCAYLSL